MSDMYCVYNGKKYKIKKKNDKYIITSRVRKEDFINYIDVCIFRKNRALAPHERSAVPLGTDHCPVG